MSVNWRVYLWGGFGILAILAILLGTGIIPGIRKQTKKIELTLWSIEDERVWHPIIAAYQKTHPTTKITYTRLGSLPTYEADLINKLASGNGPDIFLFPHTWGLKHGDKILPAPQDLVPFTRVQDAFPTVVEQDFTSRGMVYALPLSLDTLALFYNKDIFDRRGITFPPASWIDFQNLVQKLGKNSAAIGGSARTITSAPDILMALMMQGGVPMGNHKGGADLRDADSALSFYTKFANSASSYYAWDNKLPMNFERFARGNLALMFGYAYDARALLAVNPALRFGIAEMPQSSRAFVNYADYSGLAVWNRSSHPREAWEFIADVTMNADQALLYAQGAGSPPALRSVLPRFAQDPFMRVFAAQALTARSWPQIDSVFIYQIMSDMIESIHAGTPIRTALETAERMINDLATRHSR